MHKVSYKIRFHQRGSLLLDFLSKNFTYYSTLQWKKEIEKLHILVNERPTTYNTILQTGDIVEFYLGNFQEPNVDKNYKILYEDDWIIAVSKSGNLPVHPAGRYKQNTLLEILKLDFKSNFHVIHRLDRETSGLVLFAKEKEAVNKFQKLFEKRLIKKEYIVYVFGSFPPNVCAKGWILPDENSNIRKKQIFSYEYKLHGIECHTEFHLLKKNDKISKILAIPYTGRMHQIRASLCSLGFPVVGDKIYGEDETCFLKFLESGISQTKLLDRQALHAYSLSFEHPHTKKNLYLKAEEPIELSNLLL